MIQFVQHMEHGRYTHTFVCLHLPHGIIEHVLVWVPEVQVPEQDHEHIR